MKRIIASLAAIAMMAGAAPVFAGDQNFEGHDTNNPLTGTLNVEQTVALTCNAAFNAYFESDGKKHGSLLRACQVALWAFVV